MSVSGLLVDGPAALPHGSRDASTPLVLEKFILESCYGDFLESFVFV